MISRAGMIMENRRRQHAVVVAHKRKIRDEVRPKMRDKQREWNAAAIGHKVRIRHEWYTQVSKARQRLREQRMKHHQIVMAGRAKIMEQRRK